MPRARATGNSACPLFSVTITTEKRRIGSSRPSCRRSSTRYALGMFFIAILALAHPAPSYTCNYAKIRAPRQQGSVTVHAAPSKIARQVKVLKSGTDVYICDETREWVEVWFQADRHPCPGTANGLHVQRTTTCKRGWVRQAQVDVLSG